MGGKVWGKFAKVHDGRKIRVVLDDSWQLWQKWYKRITHKLL